MLGFERVRFCATARLYVFGVRPIRS
jgi:hypothetical protein